MILTTSKPRFNHNATSATPRTSGRQHRKNNNNHIYISSKPQHNCKKLQRHYAYVTTDWLRSGRFGYKKKIFNSFNPPTSHWLVKPDSGWWKGWRGTTFHKTYDTDSHLVGGAAVAVPPQRHSIWNEFAYGQATESITNIIRKINLSTRKILFNFTKCI